MRDRIFLTIDGHTFDAGSVIDIHPNPIVVRDTDGSTVHTSRIVLEGGYSFSVGFASEVVLDTLSKALRAARGADQDD